MATRILSTIGVVLYLAFLVAIKWGGQAATASTSTAKCSARDAKYVAWFEGLPSQFSIVPTSLTIKEILYKWTHEALILGVEPGHQRDSGAQRTAAPL